MARVSGLGGGGARRGPRIPPRLVIAMVIAGVALASYLLNSSVNPVTGKKQHIAMTPQQEIAIGLQAAPEVARQFGGLSADTRADALVDAVGAKLLRALPAEAPRYEYEFHVLADRETVNAFALPGGQIFITEALLSRLRTEGQLAGVLGHEMGHVVGRHSAERMAKAQLAQGLVGATSVAASETQAGAQAAGQMAAQVSQFILMSYGREDELESDALGVRFMAAAGYDPRSLIEVMQILAEASGGAGQAPEFMSTHPDPGNRAERIKAHIAEVFPQGVPEGMVR